MTQAQATHYELRRIRQQRERERRQQIREAIIAVLALILAFALFAAIGGDGEAELRAHDAWMQQLKDSGAWVMW